MARIEITATSGKPRSSRTHEGKLVKGSFLTHDIKGKKGIGTWRAYDLDAKTTLLVMSCCFNDIAPDCTEIDLSLAAAWSKLTPKAEIHLRDPDTKERCSLKFQFDGGLGGDWANPYTINEYCQAVGNVTQELAGPISFDQDFIFLPGFNLSCTVRSRKNLIAEEIEYWQAQIESICVTAENRVLGSLRRDSLVTFFDFPRVIRNSCQQYLIYFVQFLEDLGIKADSEIKEEAGRVLFSVTPSDGPSALGRVKEALEAYLDLPRNPQFGTAVGEATDMAAIQLKSQVFFLQSQLELAKATIQAKDAAIDALNIATFQQRQLLTSGQTPIAPKNMEPILGDTVHLTEYEGKGFRIDLPTILRRLKRSFGVGQVARRTKPALPPGPDDESD